MVTSTSLSESTPSSVTSSSLSNSLPNFRPPPSTPPARPSFIHDGKDFFQKFLSNPSSLPALLNQIRKKISNDPDVSKSLKWIDAKVTEGRMLPETAEIFRKKLRADSSLGDNLLRTDSPYKWLKGNESVELIRRIEAEAKARDWNDEEWKIRLALGALDGGLYGVTADAINLKRGELFERYKTIIEVAIKDKSSQLGRLVGVFFEQEIKKDREERKKALDAYPGEKVGNVFVATSAAGLQRFINSHPVLNRGGTLTERGAKNVLALLAAIGGAEVEGFEGPEGYNIIQGGSSFDPYNTPGHPGIAGPASDAAGKYQFISPTWNGNSSAVAPLLGLPSSQVPMTPQNQDAFAIYLAMAVRGVTVDDFNNSNFEVINQKLVDEWAVLQHGGVGSYDKDGVNQSSVSSEDVAARAAAM